MANNSQLENSKGDNVRRIDLLQEKPRRQPSKEMSSKKAHYLNILRSHNGKGGQTSKHNASRMLSNTFVKTTEDKSKTQAELDTQARTEQVCKLLAEKEQELRSCGEDPSDRFDFELSVYRTTTEHQNDYTLERDQ